MDRPNRLRALAAAAVCISALAASTARAQPGRAIPPAAGPYIDLKPVDLASARRFGPGDKVVMTHYFYWYDAPSRAHVINADGSDALTTHPPTLEGFSYKNAAWHKQQLKDMIAAGIDVLLPVFWGTPADQKPGTPMHWSFEGLPPLVQALDELKAEGVRPPAVGLFYDTSTLEANAWGLHVDLTTDFGRDWFFATVRDFFSMIPPRHWALLEGRPIVVLYSAAFAAAHDQSCIDHLKVEFSRRFGGATPCVVRETSWNVKADAAYAWGGAINPNFHGGVAEIGPGYDHSAVPGRKPLVVDRADGSFYERAWTKALGRKPRIVIIETWNEFHEGTTIAEAREYGRKYIDATRKYVDLFKQGIVPPPPATRYTGAAAVAAVLGPDDVSEGLERLDAPDGRTIPTTAADRTGRMPVKGVDDGRYMYFRVDDGFKTAPPMRLTVEVDYYDAAPGAIGLQYDSTDESAALNGAYKSAASARLSGSKAWKTARFNLPDARLGGVQNVGADFRIVFEGVEPAVRAVRVVRAQP